jgi:dipeptidase E
LIVPLRRLVASDRPYLDASAGTNMAAPTLKTINDMAIVQPVNFGALGVVPFQVNCHSL